MTRDKPPHRGAAFDCAAARPRSGRWLLAGAMAGALLAASPADAQDQPASGASVEGQGKRFYESVCAKCHETGIGPVITGRGLDPVIYTTIARQGNRAMPAFRVSDIDDATLQDLANYLSKTPAKPATTP